MDDQFQLLLKMGVHPYKYMDDWEKVEENHLPLIEAFYSRLNLLRISEHDHDHAQSIWKAFEMKNLGDYHDLCLKTDVLLLCNMFETFRMTCLDYTLNPAHFYTSNGLAWQACFNPGKESLQYLDENNLYSWLMSQHLPTCGFRCLENPGKLKG